MIGEGGRQRPNQWQGLALQAKYYDPCREGRRMPQDVCEVTIEGDENPPFPGGDGKDLLIGRAREPLIACPRNVMPGLLEDGPNAVGHILVELDGSHDYADMGTMLSRERSAAYASAAAIASLGKPG